MTDSKSKIIFKAKHFDELSLYELYEIMRARSEVFLLEQNIVCQDLDRVDYKSLHCFLECDGKISAYLRAFLSEEAEGYVQIGRVLSIPHRNGLGKRLMAESLPHIAKNFGCDKIMLHAQTHAKKFYEKLGFYVISEEFLEEGVPHVTMTLENVKC